MKTLIHFRDFVNEMTESASRLHKQEVLKKYKDDEVIKKYLKIAYDPYTVFGISEKKLSKSVGGMTPYTFDTIFELFDYLTVHNTGRDCDVKLCQATLEKVYTEVISCTWLLEELICKDLSIGVDSKSINSVIPNLIPTFSLQLAQKYFDRPEYWEGRRFAITTKIDGGRIIAIKENGQVSFFTRAGQKYEGLVDLEEELMKLPDNICLDGEITLYENAGISSKDAYKETMKRTRKDGPKTGIKMLVFDAMSADEFKKQDCQLPYTTRRAFLESLFSKDTFKYFEILPILYDGEDTSMITKCLDEAIANNQEGIMINDVSAPYYFTRTWSLCKVKKMNTMDLQIIGFEEGTGRLAGTLGAILVRYKNGNVVKVGSGFTDWLRTEIWNNQNKYLNAICEVKYFETSVNQDGGESLRFPIFVDIRNDKTEADY